MTFQSIYFIRFLNNLHEKSVGKQPNAECLWLFHSCTERELCVYSGDPRKVRARESESSLQTETAAAWAGETRRALKSNENLDRNERCLAIELSTLGTYSFSRQSSNSDESSPGRARTSDTRINSPLLCRLSYRGIFFVGNRTLLASLPFFKPNSHELGLPQPPP
jgi:hypothetical protein